MNGLCDLRDQYHCANHYVNMKYLHRQYMSVFVKYMIRLYVWLHGDDRVKDSLVNKATLKVFFDFIGYPGR